ncbi:MAG: cyclic nucleotide-binding domain-containing protein [Bacteroidota bacterium]|nr:cyclic nucleotide-binding domain-containing protein [Bacteroidota bacterium]
MKHTAEHSEQLIQALAASTLFRKVSSEMLKELVKKMKITNHASGETIINKDDVGYTMYFIMSGEVKIHDKEHLLARLGNGEFFGEMSILDREPRSMSVTAIEPSVTGSILRNDFFEVLNRYPGMTVELIGFISRRLRKLNKFMVEQLRNREKELEQQVAERTSDLEKKNAELEDAIIKIRQSQQQLIMQEKLASLGSLTAGVAHELHNPLNFVNNFTELSIEMINEATATGNVNDIEVMTTTLKRNLDKILFHGQRAESIIKSMIMHSNTSTGKKTLTDINTLCEQSANMVSYSTNNVATGCPVRLEKDFESGLPQIEVIPRDISRVLINLLNNAFYEVNRKWKKSPLGYEPKINITTSRMPGSILISIEDNGFGILKKIRDKIFEPFFTTKPTGDGVGLGLSISNDIIAAHGGKIRLESVENSNSRFILTLPS